MDMVEKMISKTAEKTYGGKFFDMTLNKPTRTPTHGQVMTHVHTSALIPDVIILRCDWTFF